MKRKPQTTFKWDRNLKAHVEIPIEEHPLFKKNGEAGVWVAFNYAEQMKLARQTRNVLLAVLAELHQLYYKAWNKKEPVVFNASALGFKRESIARALKVLENAGWVSVERNRAKAARVKLLKGFRL